MEITSGAFVLFAGLIVNVVVFAVVLLNSDPYNKGYKDYQRGHESHNNRYKPGTCEHILWADGWHAAMVEDKC